MGKAAGTGFTYPVCGGTGAGAGWLTGADGPYGETMREKRAR